MKKVLDAAGAAFDDLVELESWFTDDMADLKTSLAAKGFSMPGILVEIKCKAVLGLGPA